MDKLRAQQVVIDTPQEGGNIWINTVIQKLIKNEEGEITQRIDRAYETHRSLSEVFEETKTIMDPVTGQRLTVSGAGAAMIVKAFVLSWMQEDHGGNILKDDNNNNKELVNGYTNFN